MMERALYHLTRRVRPDARGVDGSWSTSDLAAQLARMAVAAGRAKLVLAGVKGGDMCFVEPRVSIAGRAHLTMGRGCVLERGVHLRAFGRGGLTLGNGVTIGRYTVVEVSSGLAAADGEIVLEDGVGISDHCFLGGAGGLHIGANTIVGQSVSFHPENHETTGGTAVKSNAVTRQGIRIGAGCWIGAGSRILDGVTVGDNSTIGAGSVVTRSLPPDSVAFGVPARVRTPPPD